MTKLILSNEEVLEINDNSSIYDVIFSLESIDSIKDFVDILTSDKTVLMKIVREDGDISHEETYENYTLSSYSFNPDATTLHAYFSAPPVMSTGTEDLERQIQQLTELNSDLMDRANAAEILLGGI